MSGPLEGRGKLFSRGSATRNTEPRDSDTPGITRSSLDDELREDRLRAGYDQGQDQDDSIIGLSLAELQARSVKSVEDCRAEQKTQRDEHISPFITINQLPSGFAPYAPDAEFSIRGYTVGEIELFNEVKDGMHQLSMVLEGISTTLDKEDITHGDYLYLALMRKLNTFATTEFQWTADNPHWTPSDNSDTEGEGHGCRPKLVGRIDLNDLEFSELEVGLPIRLDNMVFMPLTIAGWRTLHEAQDFSQTAQLAACCRNLDFEQARAEIRALPGRDSLIIPQILAALDLGINPTTTVCPDCGKEVLVRVTNPEVIVLPFCRTEGDFESRVSFGQSRVG